MKQQILVDMDGVLADTYTQHITYQYEESGIKLEKCDLEGDSEDVIFPAYFKHVNSEGFFRTVPLIADSVEGLAYLNDKYDVLVVSSATEYPTSMNDKHFWLRTHFPYITWEQMIFCGRKDSIKGDIMIDDHLKNLSKFSGRKMLFHQPHNIKYNQYERVHNWKEIMNIL